jgi:DNA-dependent RNA polymerase auxiliary subunit epsilon
VAMIIGNVSVDPRRVVEAELTALGNNLLIKISLLYGNTISITDAIFDDINLANEALVRLDKHSYKTELIDAISDKEIEDEDDDDLSDKIGFKLDRN